VVLFSIVLFGSNEIPCGRACEQTGQINVPRVEFRLRFDWAIAIRRDDAKLFDSRSSRSRHDGVHVCSNEDDDVRRARNDKLKQLFGAASFVDLESASACAGVVACTKE
jgi:hypothetical protein